MSGDQETWEKVEAKLESGGLKDEVDRDLQQILEECDEEEDEDWEYESDEEDDEQEEVMMVEIQQVPYGHVEEISGKELCHQ